MADDNIASKPIKYGDVFVVSDEDIGNKTIAPLDAAAMQSAEDQVLGHTIKGGPAAIMQSAATKNVQAGVVPEDAVSDVGTNQGMNVTETIHGDQRLITHSIGDQVVGRHAHADDMNPNETPEKAVSSPSEIMDPDDELTIGEALEISAISAGDKPITHTEAAAIQAAEMLVTGRGITPGGLGAEAQSAASNNEHITSLENKITLGDVLTDAAVKLADDKPATIEDAERVIAAEERNDPNSEIDLGGVGESMATAARINQQKTKRYHTHPYKK